MIEKLITTLNPKYWYSLDKYDKNVDDWLLNAMEHYEIEPKIIYGGRKVYEIEIDGKILWISNYPYKTFTYRSLDYVLYDVAMTSDCKYSGRASRATIYKFNKKLTKWLKENNLERA